MMLEKQSDKMTLDERLKSTRQRKMAILQSRKDKLKARRTKFEIRRQKMNEK